MKKIAVTMGDAAGIGPEIILKAFNEISDVSHFVLIGNREIFKINEEICGKKLPENLDFIDKISYNSIISFITWFDYSKCYI